MVITHEKELLALMGRQVEVIDPSGYACGWGLLVRLFDAGRIYWRVAHHQPHIGWSSEESITFELSDVADIAGTVIELRGAP